MSATAVLNDVQVLKKMSFKKALLSAQIASLLGLTTFQVTARLASMEKRQLIKRDKKGRWIKLVSWKIVKQQQAEAAKAKTVRVAAWKAGLPPEAVSDEGVPRIDSTKGWRMVEVPYSDNGYVCVYTDPSTGTEYVRAHFAEKATLIRTFTDLPPVRLVIFDKKNKWFRAVKDYHEMLKRTLQEAV